MRNTPITISSSTAATTGSCGVNVSRSSWSKYPISLDSLKNPYGTNTSDIRDTYGTIQINFHCPSQHISSISRATIKPFKKVRFTSIELVMSAFQKSHSFGEPNSAQISSAIWFIATHSARVTCFFPASYSHGERMSKRPSATASNKPSPGL